MSSVKKRARRAGGRIAISFRTPLPGMPTILVPCADPRSTVKVHAVSPAGCACALYRTKEILEGTSTSPFEGAGAAQPVIDFREAQNIDIAWVALSGGQ